MKKIIIAGSAGEVGLNLCEILTNEYPEIFKEYNIYAIDKNKNNIKLLKRLYPKIRTVITDVSKIGSWTNTLKDADVVITVLAQISSPNHDAYVRNNYLSVKNVVDVCKKYDVKKLVHASSSQVISKAVDHYTITKRQAEEYVHKSRVPHIILRPTLMYGCFDIKHLGYLTTFYDITPIFPMPGSGKYVRQPLYVKDFCRIIIRCAGIQHKNERYKEIPADNKIYDITGKEKITVIDLLKTIAKKKHKKLLFIKIPIPIFHALIKSHNIVNKKTRIISDQLTALIAGDMFKVTNWEKTFNVKYTPFDKGAEEMVNSKYYKYAKEMTRSNE